LQTVVVTGIAGNLGQRLALQLEGWRVVGIDFAEPASDARARLARFVRLDLGIEESCTAMVRLFAEERPAAVVHLAFVIDPLRTGVLDVDRMWRINVAGTARVMEAVLEHQRRGGDVAAFVFPSSVSAYGPELREFVNEGSPLRGHTLPYAIHKREADDVVRQRAPDLAPCRTFILRPHLFAGATMQNYLIGVLRGTPGGRSKWAERLRARGTRLPALLPAGPRYLRNRYQFVHVDDVARLIVYLLRRAEAPGEVVTVLNVGGRGEPATIARAAELAGQKIVQLPGKWLVHAVLTALWKLGITDFPPQAFPYLAGEYCMDLSRLRQFLGNDYERVMQYSVEEALRDSFATAERPSTLAAAQPV
jgi:nucleoside-diphosphate-sugar epimerase